MAADNKVIVEIGAEDNATKVLNKVADESKKFGEAAAAGAEKGLTGFQKFSAGLKSMAPYALAGGAAIAAGFVLAVNAARGAEEQMARVDATLKTMGKTGMAAKDQILKVADSMVKLGFDDEDAAESMAKLYQRTNNLTEAQKLTALAADLARAKHIELSEATNLVGQVLSGNGKALKQYGIDINDAASPMQALSELQGKVAGQSEAYANTFNGQMARLSVTWQNFLEEVGTPLLGILTKLIQKFLDFVDSMGGVPAILEKIKTVIDVVAPAFIFLWETISFVTQFIIQAITDVRTIWENDMFYIQTITMTFISAISLAFQAMWLTIKTVFQLGWAAVTGNWGAAWVILQNYITKGADILGAAWKGMMDGISAVTSGVWEGVKNVFKSGINWIIDKMNAFISGLSSVTGAIGKAIGQKNWSIPTIPHLAQGGIVNRPTVALIGEAGPEAVVPLSGRTRGAGGLGTTIVITGNSFYGDDEQFMQKLGDQLFKMLQPHMTFSTF